MPQHSAAEIASRTATSAKQKYGETDKITNFFTGDHSRPTERIHNLQRQIQLNYTTPPPLPPKRQ